MIRLFLPILIALPAISSAAEAENAVAVRFEQGESSAVVSGQLSGDEFVDYTLRAKAGQFMTVTLDSESRSQYFNIIPPGEDSLAIFVGSTQGGRFTGVLPADGEYCVRLYLMGQARDTGATVSHELGISITDAEDAGEAFGQDLELQGVTFRVRTTTVEGKLALRISATGIASDDPVVVPVDGAITDAEVADLDSDGSPEVYVYLRGWGPQAEGGLVACATLNKASLVPIALSPIREGDPNFRGYTGGDDFAVVETTLVRRYAIGSTTRQIQYKLRPGEALPQLVVDKVIEY